MQKKNLKKLLLILSLAIISCVIAIPAMAIGEEPDSPSAIAITSEEGIQALRDAPSNNYYLDADIDWSELTNQGQLPAISGTFDGNGHTISNLKITDGVGLFESISQYGIVKNLKITNANIGAAGVDNVGALAGINNGTIDNCFVECADITGKTNVGGLVGTNAGNINFSSVSGKVTGESQVGGIVGQMTSGVIEKAASTAKVTAQNDSVDFVSRAGGFIGYFSQGSIVNSFSLGGPIDGAQSTGGFVGEMDNGASITTSYTASRAWGIDNASNRGAFVGLDNGGIYTNCYYIGQHNQKGTSGVTNITEADQNGKRSYIEPEGVKDTYHDYSPSTDKKDKESYQGFDFDSVWTMESEFASSYPILEGMKAQGTCVENPMEINTLEELQAIPHVSALHYKLMNSFDLADTGWSPIHFFAGNFDGNCNTLSNITVNESYVGGAFGNSVGCRITNLTVDGATLEKPTDFGDRTLSGIGAFGSLNSGSAENLTVKNITVYGRQCSAAMFGVSQDSKIKDCHVIDSNVYGIFKEDPNYINHPTAIGGMVGEVFGDNEISDCTVTNTNVICDMTRGIQQNARQIGGMLGDVFQSHEAENYITNCHVYGGKVQGRTAVGGLIGMGGDAGLVKECSSSATVEGENNVGGFIGTCCGEGEYLSKYVDCFATGDVKAQFEVGGFAGTATSNASISKCYATGNVEGIGYWPNNSTSAAGGFVGVSYIAASITDCYATGDVTARKGGGGFVGTNQNLSCRIEHEFEPMIMRCYATGNVTATDQFGSSLSGGFMGHNGFGASTVKDCYSTGNVSGFKNCGGFVGLMDSSNAVNCYTTSKVTVTQEGTAGGFAGIAMRTYYDQLRFLNCIYDKDATGVDKAIAYIDPSVKLPKNSKFAWPDPNWPVDNIKGYTSEQMTHKDSFKSEGDFQYKTTWEPIITVPVEWDFENVWSIAEGSSTPYLTALGNDSLIELVADTKIIDANGTATITLNRQIPDENDIVTWEISGTGTFESTTDTTAVVKANGDGVIKVSVLINGVKKRTIEIVAGNGGEEGIKAIFVSPAPLADGTAYNINTTPTLKIKFSEPINVTEFNKLIDPILLKGFASKKIEISTSFSEKNTLLTIVPKEKLANGTMHNISVSKEVKGMSGLTLKGITSMQFLTNSFEAPTSTIEKDGIKVDTLKAGETYTINAEFINNIPNFEESDVFEKANVYIVVRTGMGARETFGGDILASVGKEISIINKAENVDAAKGTVSTEFTLDPDAEGNVYIDIYTWDENKKFAKALPAHISYKISK